MKKLNKYLTLQPVVSFSSVRTPRSHLVRAKVYPVGERLVGSKKCSKNRCQVCKSVIETETFQSFVDKKVYKTNHRFTRSDKCLVYLLLCKICGMQYNGQTNDEFRYRWINYKDNNRKTLSGEDHIQAGFFSHFQTAGHPGFINNSEIRFTDKTDPSDSTRCEDFWIDTLKARFFSIIIMYIVLTIIWRNENKRRKKKTIQTQLLSVSS